MVKNITAPSNRKCKVHMLYVRLFAKNTMKVILLLHIESLANI